jgi:hypothetical protein
VKTKFEEAFSRPSAAKNGGNKMRKIAILTAAVSLVAGGAALAGLNPEAPQLPVATYGTVSSLANNAGSSMCVDCHSRMPQTTGGTHFVSANLSNTHSSGGWVDAKNAVASARVAAEAGQYFNYTATAWASGGYSKYYNGTRSVIPAGATGIDLGDGNPVTPVTDTDAPDFYTSALGGANPATFELICESCHNVIVNVAGGNNLLDYPGNGDWVVQDATEADLCVGCHGFMYSATQLGSQPAPSAHGAGNWANARNTTDGTVKRGNSESHNIYGVEYAMNHHVMYNDQITPALVSDGFAWRDVLTFSGVAYTMNADTAFPTSQYPVDGTWGGSKVKPGTPANGINCLNCHAMGHGAQGGVQVSPASTGASILADTTADASIAGDSTTGDIQINRLGEGGRTWMGFNDNFYCNNCHHIPNGTANE